MFVLMLETQKGADDGNQPVKKYEKGEVYEVGPSLGKVFIDNDWAKESKAVKEAPEDKAIKGVDEDKGEEGLTVKELKAALDDMGVEYSKKANKAELEALLEEAEGADHEEEAAA